MTCVSTLRPQTSATARPRSLEWSRERRCGARRLLRQVRQSLCGHPLLRNGWTRCLHNLDRHTIPDGQVLAVEPVQVLVAVPGASRSQPAKEKAVVLRLVKPSRSCDSAQHTRYPDDCGQNVEVVRCPGDGRLVVDSDHEAQHLGRRNGLVRAIPSLRQRRGCVVRLHDLDRHLVADAEAIAPNPRDTVAGAGHLTSRPHAQPTLVRFSCPARTRARTKDSGCRQHRDHLRSILGGCDNEGILVDRDPQAKHRMDHVFADQPRAPLRRSSAACACCDAPTLRSIGPKNDQVSMTSAAAENSVLGQLIPLIVHPGRGAGPCQIQRAKCNSNPSGAVTDHSGLRINHAASDSPRTRTR